MRLPSASASASKQFEDLVSGRAGITSKKVFGQPAAFVNGNMFFGVFGEGLFVRLSEVDRMAAREDPGFRPFEPMPGRAMTEYMVIPKSILASRSRGREWVDRSLAYASKLPPKTSKSRR